MTTKPGEMALAVMATSESGVEFKKPLPYRTRKTKKPKVLAEDTYLQRIDKIIQRDFFPDLEKLNTQNDYLDAVRNNDFPLMQRICAKYSLENTPWSVVNEPFDNENYLNSPACSETSEWENRKKKKGYEKNLDAFLSTHTSEDNQSFEELVQEEEERFKIKNPWLFKEDEQKKREIGESALDLPSSDRLLSLTEKDKSQNDLKSWTYKDKNYIMYVPDGIELSAEQKIEISKNKQEIVHPNTRLQYNPFDDRQNKDTIREIAYKQSQSMEGKIGVDGKELVSETPKINGWRFVRTPSPAPGVDQSPLMTWGQIEGTPFRLDGSDTPRSSKLPGPVFTIAEQPKREKLAHKLAEKVGEKHRNKKQKALDAAKRQLIASSPGILSGQIDKYSLLSPAAQKLASAHMRARINTDISLRRSYTPKHSPLCTSEYISSNCDSERSSCSLSSVKSPRTPFELFKENKCNLEKNRQKLSDISKTVRRPEAADFFQNQNN